MRDRVPVHFLSIAHVPVCRDSTCCAYTMKVYNGCRMLRRLGYKVILYGLEGSDASIADEFVPVVSTETWRRVYGGHDQRTHQFQWDVNDDCWAEFRRRASFEIVRHFQSADPANPEFVFCSFGWGHQPCTKKLFDNAIVVESGIGYREAFANFRIYESYALYHVALGQATPNGVVNGKAYWTVIPNYLDPDEFEFREKKGDYFLFMGRLNEDKGYGIALDTAKFLGSKIVCVGQLPAGNEAYCTRTVERIKESGGLYMPAVGPDARRELMAGAKAVFVPSQYVEPFGGVHMEAMASGTPVITTDWGVFPETVIQGITGYRCKTLEEFVWAAKNIGRIQPAACRQWAVGNYSMDAIGPRYDAYMQKLLNLQRGKGWEAISDAGPLPYEVTAMQRQYPMLVPAIAQGCEESQSPQGSTQ